MCEVLVFFRKEGFYPIDALPGVPLRKQAEDQARLNPGTLKVEDLHGNVLWSPDEKVERFIILESDKGYRAMRQVATLASIHEEAEILRLSGRYISVIVAQDSAK